MAVPTPDLFWLVAEEALQCVCTALADTACGCPCRACVVFGPPVWDQCCDGGQLTTFLERVYVAKSFPSAETGQITCSAPLAGDFVIQLLRCVPTVAEDGTPPSCQAISDSAKSIYTDMYVAFRAIICCLAAYKKLRTFTIREARPVGPQGGCAGFEIRFTIELVDPIPVI